MTIAATSRRPFRTYVARSLARATSRATIRRATYGSRAASGSRTSFDARFPFFGLSKRSRGVLMADQARETVIAGSTSCE
jgi:hypothetical protein